ncbi:MAG: GHKL domain-containing protein, partial [Clostridia bacterium]|nr:GHKL domain-containing protein [Clostridia bacterium]
MVVYIINIFIYLFAAWLFWYYAENAFGTSRPQWVVLLSFFAVHAVQCVICCVFAINWLNLVLGVTGIFLLYWLLYEQKWYAAALHAVMLYAVLTLAEYLVLPILSLIFKSDFNDFRDNTVFYFYGAVFSKMLDLIFTIILLKVYLTFFKKGDPRAKQNGKGLLFSLVVPFTSITVLTLVQYHLMQREMDRLSVIIWTVTVALLMLSTFFVFYYRNYLLKQGESLNALQLEKKQQEFDNQYYAIIEKSNEEMQILSHDFKNHLIQIDNAENMEQVHAYVAKLYPSIRQFDSAAISSNKTLNVIMSKYNTLCTVKGVAFKYHIESALNYLEASDLSAIFNNLLDNALEAALLSTEKRIELKVIKKNKKLDSIVLTNAADSAPVEDGGELLSSKSSP